MTEVACTCRQPGKQVNPSVQATEVRPQIHPHLLSLLCGVLQPGVDGVAEIAEELQSPKGL